MSKTMRGRRFVCVTPDGEIELWEHSPAMGRSAITWVPPRWNVITGDHAWEWRYEWCDSKQALPRDWGREVIDQWSETESV